MVVHVGTGAVILPLPATDHSFARGGEFAAGTNILLLVLKNQ
jgi:hypothetical protein